MGSLVVFLDALSHSLRCTQGYQAFMQWPSHLISMKELIHDGLQARLLFLFPTTVSPNYLPYVSACGKMLCRTDCLCCGGGGNGKTRKAEREETDKVIN